MSEEEEARLIEELNDATESSRLYRNGVIYVPREPE